MFDKGVGYMQLKKRLKSKWNLKGDFSLIDIGCDYFVTRFTNMEDRTFVVTQGPWMIGDNYLTICRWVPNFVPDEEPIRFLTTWIRIPNISIEYFDHEFLDLIGQKIGKVISVDQTTANVERGNFSRLSVEVVLSKPLLSKFKLHGRVWKIQYEGLRLLCFHCGKVGHKAETCPTNHSTEGGNVIPTTQDVNTLRTDPIIAIPMHKPESVEQFGPWMLVKKPSRKKNPNATGDSHRNNNGSSKNLANVRMATGL